MARDYSKLKALAQEIIKCIGDEPEGEHPQYTNETEKEQEDPAGNIPDFSPEQDETGSDPDDKKKKKKSNEASMAMMSSLLGSKFTSGQNP